MYGHLTTGYNCNGDTILDHLDEASIERLEHLSDAVRLRVVEELVQAMQEEMEQTEFQWLVYEASDVLAEIIDELTEITAT